MKIYDRSNPHFSSVSQRDEFIRLVYRICHIKLIPQTLCELHERSTPFETFQCPEATSVEDQDLIITFALFYTWNIKH